jgi:hypothetical protein
MSCKRCSSANQSRFTSEISIHLPVLVTPHVFLCPKVVVCLDCGFTEFSIPETELPRLAKQDSTTGRSGDWAESFEAEGNKPRNTLQESWGQALSSFRRLFHLFDRKHPSRSMGLRS